jgi:hypothetical protein
MCVCEREQGGSLVVVVVTSSSHTLPLLFYIFSFFFASFFFTQNLLLRTKMGRFPLLFLSLSSVLRILALAFTSVGVSMVTAADFEGRNAPVLDFGGKIGSKNFERGRKEEDERKTVGESILGKTVPPTFTLEEEDTTFEEENTHEKNENKCEECLSFLHNATEKVRSKEFRARLYKVVDEMCQRVFPDDAGEEDDKKIAECEALGKTYAKRAIEYVKTHEEETDEFVCEKLNLCADDDATVFDALRRTVRRARETFASGRRFFASSWFHPSSASSSASPPTSLCVFCEYGASKLAVAMNDPDFAAAARRDFVAACRAAEDRFSDKEQKCEAAAAEYESKIYDAVQTWLDDGEACEDLFSC